MIPNMIHPLGKHWHQPNKEDILVDDTYALMNKSSFHRLHEYSSSVPTGVYEGKMWRCRALTGWWLMWFDNENSEGLLPTLHRKIIVV